MLLDGDPGTALLGEESRTNRHMALELRIIQSIALSTAYRDSQNRIFISHLQHPRSLGRDAIVITQSRWVLYFQPYSCILHSL